MTPQLSKNLLTKGGAVFATGLVATSLFSSMPAVQAAEDTAAGTAIAGNTAGREVAVANTADLTAAVEEARAAGVAVTEKDATEKKASPSTLENILKEASDEQAAQIAALKDAVAKQKAEDVRYEKAVADRAAIIEQNKTITAANEAAEAAYQEATKAEEAVKSAGAGVESKLSDYTKAKGAGSAELREAAEAWKTSHGLWVESATTYAQKLASLDSHTDAAQAERVKAEIAAHQAKMDEASTRLADALAKLEAAEVANAELKAKFQADMKSYEEAMVKYQALKAEYDKLVADQITGADPNVAIVAPDRLAYGNPFTVDQNNSDNLISYSGGSGAAVRYTSADGSKIYNSDYQVIIPVKDGDTLEFVWGKNAATDTQSGRALDKVVTVKNIRTAEGHPAPNGPEVQAGAVTGPAIAAMSNSLDFLNLWDIAAAEVQVTYKYADTGEAYDKNFYATAGSLDSFGPSAGNYELSAPGKGVLASFIGQGSYVSPTVMPVHGKGSEIIANAYGTTFTDKYPDDIYWHNDTVEEVISKMGVTYLMENGGSFYVGTSYTGGPYTESRTGGAEFNWIYNHVMSTVQTVAPTAVTPLEPTKPAEPSYQDVTSELPDLFAAPALLSPEKPEPTPLLEVPAEPVKETITAEVKPVKVMEYQADLRIEKKVIAFNPETGELTYGFSGFNAGGATAAEATINDLPGAGLGELTFKEDTLKTDAGSIKIVDGKLKLTDVEPGDAYSGELTVIVDRTVDKVDNIITVDSADDPTGPTDDPKRNDTPEEDDDNGDKETTVVNWVSKQQLAKTLISFDKETRTAIYEVDLKNSDGIGKGLSLADLGGAGLENVQFLSATVTSADGQSFQWTPEGSAAAGSGVAKMEAGEKALAVKAADQDALEGVDVADLSDISYVDGVLKIGAMGIDETAKIRISATVAEGATDVENIAYVTSENGTDGSNGSQENETVGEDTDGWDNSKFEVPAEPEAPVTEKPAEPAPVVPAPETPAPEKAPVQNAPVIKGESAKTGAEANAQGISAGVFAGLGAAVLLGLGAVWAFVSRKKA